MRRTAALVALSTLLAVSATAGPITLVPSGLASGSTYFLAFVTNGVRNAGSSNIADYDAFVTQQASLNPTLAALVTTWKVIGSTQTVNAIDHIGVAGPVYRLDGVLLATGEADMFDGTLNAPLNISQYGDLVSTGTGDGGIDVWTGTTNSGLAVPNQYLGASGWTTTLGASTETLHWLVYGSAFPNYASNFPMFGISGPLVVPNSTVPEPASTLVLLSVGLTSLVAARRRRR